MAEPGISLPTENLDPRDTVKQFPAAPSIDLMKDGPGRVFYVGKAKNLRTRAADQGRVFVPCG